MYHYIDDKEFLMNLHRYSSDIVNRLVQRINSDDVMYVKQHLVGSGAKNLILQNANEPVDIDYNLEIISCSDSIGWENCKSIKEYIKKHFNFVLRDMNLDDCDDSTSALTTKKRHFTSGNNTEWSIDIAITCKCVDGHYERLIHNKTGFSYYDSWVWEMARDSNGLEKKVQKIKKSNYWNQVREKYRDKKNMYLQRQNELSTHPSFIVYIEVINEIYYAIFHS